MRTIGWEEPGQNDATTDGLRGRHVSRWLGISELAVIACIFWADAKHLIPFSKTPFILAIAWFSLRLRGLRWSDVGLKRDRNWKPMLCLGLLLGVLLESFQLLVTQPIVSLVIGRQPDLHAFHILTGNWKLTLLYVVLLWILAAFGEEMIYRGYLMNRVANLLGPGRNTWIYSLFLVHIGFGLAHAYQGLAGVLIEGIAGIFLGLIYLGTRRNLAVPIIAHGIVDTIDMVLFFLGQYPGA